MEYLKDKPIAVLGGGAVGKAIAGDCALGGAKVRICDMMPFAKKTLHNVDRVGIKFYGDQENLYGIERSGLRGVLMASVLLIRYRLLGRIRAWRTS